MSDAVVLLFGGTSSEHRVSVASAQNLCSVLPRGDLWFLRLDGSVQVCARPELLAHERPFEVDFEPSSSATWPKLDAALDACPAEAVVFLALHGGEGEDGTIQRLLEQRGLAFTGSGAAASAAAFDKLRAKRIVAERGIATPFSSVVRGRREEIEAQLLELLEHRGRLIAKPVANGSSIGLHRIDDRTRVPAIAREIARSAEPYLVEDFVEGRELTVGVVDERAGSVALPPSEVRLEGAEAFDYAGKYLARGTREITPAQVPAEITREAQAISLTAHRELGCEGYSRTDLIWGQRGLCFLETNTLPGLTRASFVPQQLAAAGRTLEVFVATQLQLARDRCQRAR